LFIQFGNTILMYGQTNKERI